MHKYIREVQYYETDSMKIVHHSNYIRWFEEARTDFLKSVSMPYDEIEKMGLMIPVLSVECTYKYPLKFGQRFRIELNMTEFNGVKFNFEYNVFNDETNQLCVSGKTSHCFVNDSFKPVRIMKSYPELYSTLKKQL